MITQAECRDDLLEMRSLLVKYAIDFLNLSEPDSFDTFLNQIHTQLNSDQINDLRLHVFRGF